MERKHDKCTHLVWVTLFVTLSCIILSGCTSVPQAVIDKHELNLRAWKYYAENSKPLDDEAKEIRPLLTKSMEQVQEWLDGQED